MYDDIFLPIFRPSLFLCINIFSLSYLSWVMNNFDHFEGKIIGGVTSLVVCVEYSTDNICSKKVPLGGIFWIP